MTHAGMSYVPTMKDTSCDNRDTSSFTNEGFMADNPAGGSKQAVAPFRGPRNTSSVYSSSSSTSFNSSGELQYVDPDGGEPVIDDFYESQTQQQQQQPQQQPDSKNLSISATALHEQQQQETTARSPQGEHDKNQEMQESQARNAFSQRRNPDPEEDESMAVDSKRSGDEAPSSQEDTSRETEPLDPPNFYHRDMEFEVQLLSLRNKRVLMARLNEVVPRGRLSMINLSRRGLGLEEAALLKEAIVANPRLCVLKLSYNNLGDDGVAMIASALLHDGQHHQLSVLDLGFNSIGDKGIGSLAVLCLAGNYNMQKLYLSGNQMTEKGALSLAGAILHGTGLRSLYLSVNSIGSSGLKAIAGAIAKNDSQRQSDTAAAGGESLVPRMEELHLGSTSIESDGFVALPAMLLTNTSLKSLCVSNNNLGDNDILLLSQALTQNKRVPLESLLLSFNEITCQGVECLMNAIWGSQTLREIKLDNNRIQDRGAQLCAVVLTSIALETMDLSFNKVTTTGIKALMKNLSENSSLRTLGLSGIPIDQNASKAVSYALAYNSSLQALYLDNCSTGYASQRHIVAGAVSNRKSALRVLTGFSIGPIAMTLGMPRLPENWSNDQVLGFFRLMWQQWLLKSRNGRSGEDVEESRGPAPPAAVAAAAKITFSALGNQPGDLFQTELHEKPLLEQAPVEPAGAALLERTYSGTLSVPMFTVSSEIGIDDFVDGESKVAAMTNRSPTPKLSTVRSPLENPERRNRNLQWLRLHFRALSDVGRLPFHNADLWQLHQYYFSPPSYQSDDETSPSSEDGMARAPPPTPSLASRQYTGPDSAQNFQSLLGEALVAAGAVASSEHGHKRPSIHPPEVDDGPVAKKAKNLKPRIAYYPRIMAKIQSLGTKPMDQTLSLLRQLKYTESIMFAGRNSYAETTESESNDQPRHSDVDMILLDLL